MSADKIKSPRYSLIDALRGFAVLNMVAFHLCYDIFCVFGVDKGFNTSAGAVIWERFICCSFIILSGISLNFSKHGYRRGVIVNLCGLTVTAATVLFMPSESIWFGVLNLLGCSMLMTFALKKPLDKLPPLFGMIISIMLFGLFYGVPNGYIGLFGYPLFRLPERLYGCVWLAPLGLPSADFYSSDYFPLIPWLFLFVFGYFLWRFIAQRGYQRLFTVKIPVLDFIGRHSLIIYMLHQPILYGITWLIFRGQ